VDNEPVFCIGEIKSWIGVAINPRAAVETFWTMKCPCGVLVTYPLNGLPLVDTPHPCGNPDHWTVRFYERAACEAVDNPASE
jgi:hypothetical protein